MKEQPTYITITNTETNRCLTAIETPDGSYNTIIAPPLEVSVVKKRSIGKIIREFMKEKNVSKTETKG